MSEVFTEFSQAQYGEGALLLVVGQKEEAAGTEGQHSFEEEMEEQY